MAAPGDPGKPPAFGTGRKAALGDPALRPPGGGALAAQLSEDPCGGGNFSLWMVRCKAGALLCGRKADGSGKGAASSSRCFSDSPVEAAGPSTPPGAELVGSRIAERATGLGTSMPIVLPSADLRGGTTTSDFWAPLCMTQCKVGIKERC